MRALTMIVTGTGGFIGSYLVERLMRDEVTMRAFVRYTSHVDWRLLTSLSPTVWRRSSIRQSTCSRITRNGLAVAGAGRWSPR